jgi:hypothetical protein
LMLTDAERELVVSGTFYGPELIHPTSKEM